MNNKCIIVIPTHKTVLDELEQLSLKQLDKIVDNIDMCIVHPSCTDKESIKSLFVNNEISFKQFDDEYFKSDLSYNQFCLNYDFYKAFEEYEYMLIYQTDCWIFRNEIKQFCDMGYDYIGGPIYSAGSHWPSFKIGSRPVVGNGGLSLRKISTMLKITDRGGYIYNKHKEEWNTIKYEDLFLCDVVFHEILVNVPDYRVAEQFSIDTLPHHIRELQPMAVHRVFAFYQWWQNFVSELKEEHIVELCKISYENFKRMYT